MSRSLNSAKTKSNSSPHPTRTDDGWKSASSPSSHACRKAHGAHPCNARLASSILPASNGESLEHLIFSGFINQLVESASHEHFNRHFVRALDGCHFADLIIGPTVALLPIEGDLC